MRLELRTPGIKSDVLHQLSQFGAPLVQTLKVPLDQPNHQRVSPYSITHGAKNLIDMV